MGRYLKKVIRSKKIELSDILSYWLGIKKNCVDVNFSPVCDLLFTNAHKVIGDIFSDSPEIANELVKKYCEGLRDSGILPVLKHYPGHGRSKIDTHLNVSEVDTNLNILKKTDLIPFSSLKTQSLVMLAHIFYTKVDNRNCYLFKKNKQFVKKLP